MRQKQRRIDFQRAHLVGVVHTPAGFRAADRVRPDFAEIRVDLLPAPPTPEAISRLTVPAIVTVRRHDEGGGLALGDSDREALYRELLPAACAIDIEGRSLRDFRDLVATARRSGRIVIVSHHDFETTPSAATLRSWERSARKAGADVVKIATRTESAGDAARLLGLLAAAQGPLAVMGMGTLGRASRLLFARAGSVLNYGWLAAPQVPGQWSAADLRALLARA